MMIAPTSAMARPKAARNAVTRPARPIANSVAMARGCEAPSAMSASPYSAQSGSQRRCTRAIDDRRREHGLRRDHRPRREQEAERAERPGTRQEKVDREPDDDRRQAEQRVHGDEPDLAPRHPVHGEHRAERRAEAEGEERRREADAQRQADDRDELAVERAEKRQGESEGAAELLHRRLRAG